MSQGLSGTSDTKPVHVPFQAAHWRLTWADEFDRGTAPNPKFWSYEKGYLRNDEAQCYTENRHENARIEKGCLILEARRDHFEGHEITSASIHTSKKRPFLYGRIEVRARFPVALGSWPAIWMLGENVDKVDWPRCGEIDILENVGFDPDRVHANIHVDAYNHMKGTGKGNNMLLKGPYKEFHVYAVEWTKDRLEFFFDDTRYFVFRKEAGGEAVWPFDKPQYLILNLAIGGGWGGAKGLDKDALPYRFLIDYVRYYEAR